MLKRYRLKISSGFTLTNVEQQPPFDSGNHNPSSNLSNVSGVPANLKRRHFILASWAVLSVLQLILYSQCIVIIKYVLCRDKEKRSRASVCALQLHHVKRKKKHEYGAGWFWKQTRCQHHFSEHNVLKVFD